MIFHGKVNNECLRNSLTYHKSLIHRQQQSIHSLAINKVFRSDGKIDIKLEFTQHFDYTI